MKVQIEIYRGWSISFDTEKEIFYCHSDGYDRDESKKSFAATRRFIDDFIKENETFKPLWIEANPNMYASYKKIKLIGIRKDGRFIYEDGKGDKKQLSDYSEKDYILYNEENDIYRIEAEKLEERIEELREQKKSILAKIKGMELTEYKKQFINS